MQIKNAYTNPDNPFIVVAQRIFTYAIVLVTIISIYLMPGFVNFRIYSVGRIISTEKAYWIMTITYSDNTKTELI